MQSYVPSVMAGLCHAKPTNSVCFYPHRAQSNTPRVSSVTASPIQEGPAAPFVNTKAKGKEKVAKSLLPKVQEAAGRTQPVGGAPEPLVQRTNVTTPSMPLGTQQAAFMSYGNTSGIPVGIQYARNYSGQLVPVAWQMGWPTVPVRRCKHA